MPNTLIIQLQNNEEETHLWLEADTTGQFVQNAQQNTLTAISQHCDDKSIVLLIPADEVLLLSAQLPLMKKNRLQQAIPFAIEEQLSEKAESYHFTLLGAQDASGKIAVAAMEKSRIKHWHQLLAEHNIEPNYFIPALLAAPYEANTITVMENQSNCLVRSNKTCAFLTNKENLNILLDLHLQEIDTPEKIIIWQYGESESHTALKETLPIKINTQPAEQCFPDLAKGALDNLQYNLLTGNLTAKTKKQKVKRYWQLSLVFLSLIIAVSIINTAVQYGVYSHQNKTLTNKIDELYKQNFPESTDIVAPKIRLQQKLQSLNNLANGNPYINLIGKSGQVLKNLNTVKINAIEFRNNTLYLTLSTANFSDLSVVIKKIKSTGLRVNQTNAQSKGKRVSTVLVIKELR